MVLLRTCRIIRTCEEKKLINLCFPIQIIFILHFNISIKLTNYASLTQVFNPNLISFLMTLIPCASSTASSSVAMSSNPPSRFLGVLRLMHFRSAGSSQLVAVARPAHRRAHAKTIWCGKPMRFDTTLSGPNLRSCLWPLLAEGSSRSVTPSHSPISAAKFSIFAPLLDSRRGIELAFVLI